MRRDELTELHFITPIDNLVSIMEHGIVCHQRAANLHARSIADQAVQDRRALKRLPTGRMLHEYANLYVNARNPMLFRRRNVHAQICVLSVNPAVLDLDGVVVTDMNAASDWVRHAGGPTALEIVDQDMTFAERWTHPDDQRLEWRHKSMMCAEVLVPDCVQPALIQGIHVSCDPAMQQLEGLGLGRPIRINRRLFFL